MGVLMAQGDSAMVKHFFSLGVFLVLALTACTGNAAVAEASTTISFTLSDFKIEPARVTIPAGKEITVQLSNSGAGEHTLAIMAKPVEDSFDDADWANVYFETTLQSGAQNTVSFTAPAAAGEYQVVCTTPGHIEAGMVSTLIVVQP